MTTYDLVIVGAGPAGMGAAATGREQGLSVLVIDEQPTPGGQIWRAIERGDDRDAILGPSYTEGRPVAQSFRACGAVYEAGMRIWQIEPGFRIYASRDGQPVMFGARAIILATGAQERPTPFPGWTLPGVMTVGAAQILLKTSGQIPDGLVWVAGSGPLPLLYMTQFVAAGGSLAGYLDTTPRGRWRVAMRHAPAAMRSARDLMKGLGWSIALRRAGVPIIRHVADLRAEGDGRIETLTYTTANGHQARVAASTLLVHEGVVPSLHVPASLGCALGWNALQDSFAPRLDPWGETSVTGVFVAGDGAGIGGAKAALARGKLAALGVARRLRPDDGGAILAAAGPLRRALRRELAIRPFLDAYFRPRLHAFAPSDDTIVCRCEEVRAGDIRMLARNRALGPNQVKTVTRAGMGPCQGRQCGASVNRLIAAAQNRSPADVGLPHVRPPLKPVTLAELASLQGTSSQSREE